MPRRNRNVSPKPRGHYRPEAEAELCKIEKLQAELEVPWDQVAARADISERTLRNMRRDRRAFKRHLRRLVLVLREIGKELAKQDEVLCPN